MAAKVTLTCGHKVAAEEDYGGEALCPVCKVERSVEGAWATDDQREADREEGIVLRNSDMLRDK